LRKFLRPRRLDDGTQNLVGALKTCMGTVGAKTIREMQMVELIIAPDIKHEGKLFQKAQKNRNVQVILAGQPYSYCESNLWAATSEFFPNLALLSFVKNSFVSPPNLAFSLRNLDCPDKSVENMSNLEIIRDCSHNSTCFFWLYRFKIWRKDSKRKKD